MKETIEFKNKVKFGDLSTSLKIAVVLAWIVGGIELVAFVAGFVSAF